MSEPFLSFAELVDDPDASLARAREAGPVAMSEMGPVVVRHDAVRATLQSDRLRPSFSRFLEQFGVSSGPFYDWMKASPLDMEGDAHRRWRQLVMKTFTPKSVEKLRPFLRAEAYRLIDGFADAGRVEFMDAFARKLPSLGLCELIGVPAEDRARFSGWADTIGVGFNMLMIQARIAEVDAAITNLLAYAGELIAARREDPRDDLVTRLARAAQEEDGVTEQQMRATVAGLVFAGHETTKNQLGWLVALLAEAPAAWDSVAAEPERARTVVEEVLRLRSAATSVGRLALEEVEIGGVRFPAGSTVVTSLWSANRDPAVFPRPNEIAPDANAVGVQLAFGQGAHHCLGAALARAELTESLVALSSRLTCPKVEAGATFAPPVGITGPLTLPITFARR
jgi:cytochrome P450